MMLVIFWGIILVFLVPSKIHFVVLYERFGKLE